MGSGRRWGGPDLPKTRPVQTMEQSTRQARRISCLTARVWISLYHYNRLCNNTALDPRSIKPGRLRIPELYDPWLWPWEYIPDPPPWELPSHFVHVTVPPLISIGGIVNLAGQVSVSSVMRVRAVGRLPESTPTDMIAELVGASGEVVARAGNADSRARQRMRLPRRQPRS